MRTRTRADSQFDVTVEVDIKLPKPYRKDLPKTLNRLGIREKPFYRAGDVAQLLGTVALVLWRFRTGNTSCHGEPTRLADVSSRWKTFKTF